MLKLFRKKNKEAEAMLAETPQFITARPVLVVNCTDVYTIGDIVKIVCKNDDKYIGRIDDIYSQGRYGITRPYVVLDDSIRFYNTINRVYIEDMVSIELVGEE